MKIQERIQLFWEGKKPDKIPYTIYWNEIRHTINNPVWQSLFKKGLGVTYGVSTFKSKNKKVKYKTKSVKKNGDNIKYEIMDTPVGEIYTEFKEGWRQKYWIENKSDYRVMIYIANNKDYYPAFNNFNKSIKEIEPYGIPLLQTGRTPMQTILVDYIGLENFAYHLIDFKDEMMELYEALLNNYRKKIKITADGPGEFVQVLENFTAETMGPDRFKEFHLPVYKELFPILQESGKKVGTHYDGKLSSCKDLIAEAPINLIESLTAPPEGDMPLDICRKYWPKKLFWVNINVSKYQLPEKKLKKNIYKLIEEASDDGKKLALEVSEQYPENWERSMNVVLDSLNDYKI